MIEYISTKSKKKNCIFKHRKIEYKRKLSDAITLEENIIAKKLCNNKYQHNITE